MEIDSEESADPEDYMQVYVQRELKGKIVPLEKMILEKIQNVEYVTKSVGKFDKELKR